MYRQYVEERTNDHVLETDKGFATYTFVDDKTVYIRDIFVLEEHRAWGNASKMADQIAEIAKQKGCTKMLGSVQPSAKGSTESAKVLLAYGMSVKSAFQDAIWFEKDL